MRSPSRQGIKQLHVQETQCTALCRCALAEPLAAKRRRVAALIERLALQSCADTTIGDALSRGISGGQASLGCLHAFTGADGVAHGHLDRSRR